MRQIIAFSAVVICCISMLFCYNLSLKLSRLNTEESFGLIAYCDTATLLEGFEQLPDDIIVAARLRYDGYSVAVGALHCITAGHNAAEKTDIVVPHSSTMPNLSDTVTLNGEDFTVCGYSNDGTCYLSMEYAAEKNAICHGVSLNTSFAYTDGEIADILHNAFPKATIAYYQPEPFAFFANFNVFTLFGIVTFLVTCVTLTMLIRSYFVTLAPEMRAFEEMGYKKHTPYICFITLTVIVITVLFALSSILYYVIERLALATLTINTIKITSSLSILNYAECYGITIGLFAIASCLGVIPRLKGVGGRDD